MFIIEQAEEQDGVYLEIRSWKVIYFSSKNNSFLLDSIFQLFVRNKVIKNGFIEGEVEDDEEREESKANWRLLEDGNVINEGNDWERKLIGDNWLDFRCIKRVYKLNRLVNACFDEIIIIFKFYNGAGGGVGKIKKTKANQMIWSIFYIWELRFKRRDIINPLNG